MPLSSYLVTKNFKASRNFDPPASKKIRRELLDVEDGKLLLSARTSQSTENITSLFKQNTLGSRSKPASGSITCFVAMWLGQICEKMSDWDVAGVFWKFMASHRSVAPCKAPHKTFWSLVSWTGCCLIFFQLPMASNSFDCNLFLDSLLKAFGQQSLS